MTSRYINVRKSTKTKIKANTQPFDYGLREQRTEQILVTEVMFVAGEKFLISVASPLE